MSSVTVFIDIIRVTEQWHDKKLLNEWSRYVQAVERAIGATHLVSNNLGCPAKPVSLQ